MSKPWPRRKSETPCVLMPIYCYRCPACGASEERSVPMDERNNQLCTRCGEHLDKLISPGLQVRIPISFGTSFEDYGPRSDQAKKLWKERAVCTNGEDI